MRAFHSMVLAGLMLGAFGAGCPRGVAQEDPLDSALEVMRFGVGDLREAAFSGHPLLLQEAEGEVVEGLFQALAASVEGDRLDPRRYARAYAGYEAASGLFKELPYHLEVSPGAGARAFVLTLRKHPAWALRARAGVSGWTAEQVESGMRLVAKGGG